jgi:hypothetical protein
MVGFMTSGSVEYFQTSDVLALMFDTNVEPSVSGLQPNRMNGDSPRMAAPATAQKISVQSGTDRKLHGQTTPRKANAALRYLAD